MNPVVQIVLVLAGLVELALRVALIALSFCFLIGIAMFLDGDWEFDDVLTPAAWKMLTR